LAVLIVDYPFLINDFVRPACLPPIEWAKKLIGGEMVISGMGQISYSRRELSPNMKVATIPMKSKMECNTNPIINSLFIGK